MKSISQNINLYARKSLRKVIHEAIQPGFIHHAFESEIKQVLTSFMNAGMKADSDAELDRISYERRDDEDHPYRNGYKKISIPWLFGRLHLKKPAIRKGHLKLPFLAMLKLASKEMLQNLAIRFWLGGSSTRDTADDLREVFGANVSASSISAMTDTLEETVIAFEERKIPDDILFLILDATYIPFRRWNFTKDHAILCGIGIDSKGQKHVLGFLLGDRENEESWTLMIKTFIQKGLNPNVLKLVVSDEHKAIIASVEKELGTDHQYCLFHKLMNVKALIASPDKKEMIDDFKDVYWAISREESMKAIGKFQAKWEKKYPKAVEIGLRNYEHHVMFFSVEQKYWKTLRTSNLIERFNREIKRRIKNAGTLGSELALRKLFYSVASKQEKRWHKIKD
jgi:putative transposase